MPERDDAKAARKNRIKMRKETSKTKMNRLIRNK